MRRLLILLQIAALVLVTAAIFGQNTDNPPADQAKEFGIMVTYGTGPAWKPTNAPVTLDPHGIITEALDKYIAEHPEDLRVDLGEFTTPHHTQESSFDSVTVTAFTERKWDVINVAPLDYINYGMWTLGYHRRPPQQDHLFIGSLDWDCEGFSPLPTAQTINRDGLIVEVAGVSDSMSIGGIPYAFEHLVQKDPNKLIQDAIDRKAASNGLALVFSSFTPGKNDEFARQFPAIDLILETAPGAADAVRKVGTTFIVPRQERNEFQRLAVKRKSDGALESVTAVRTAWTDPDIYKQFSTPALPIIGMSVQPPERVSQRLHIAQDDVRVDVHRGVSLPEFTTRKDVYVYHVVLDGKPLHFYRVNRIIGRGWINFDAMVVLNDDHTINRIVPSDDSYAIISVGTRFGEVVTSIANKTPDQWIINPDQIAGYEDRAAVILDSLRKTIEVDKILYPESTTPAGS